METENNNLIALITAIYTIIHIIIRITPTVKDDLFLKQSGGLIQKISYWVNKILQIINTLFNSSNEFGKSENEVKKIIACQVLEQLQNSNPKVYEYVENETLILQSKIKMHNMDCSEFTYKTKVETIIEENMRGKQ